LSDVLPIRAQGREPAAIPVALIPVHVDTDIPNSHELMQPACGSVTQCPLGIAARVIGLWGVKADEPVPSPLPARWHDGIHSVAIDDADTGAEAPDTPGERADRVILRPVKKGRDDHDQCNGDPRRSKGISRAPVRPAREKPPFDALESGVQVPQCCL